jgi:PmbA protein
MRALSEIKSFAREAAEALARERDLGGFEFYTSSSEDHVARINYTSDIPSRGLEEFKSLNAEGFALRIVMKHDVHATGTASMAGELSIEALREGLKRARSATIIDPHFGGLAATPIKLPAGQGPGANDLMRAQDGILASAAWSVIGGAIKTFTAKGPRELDHPGLILGGDFSLIRDRIAVTNSHFREIRTDENARFNGSVTVLIEALEAKGTASAIGASKAAMARAGSSLGREAVLKALALRDGERPPPGPYRVVLGAQPLAEIVNYMVLPSLTAGAFHASSSAYHGRFGRPVMDSRLSLIDDPLAPEGPVRRRITCEGLPAAKSELIRDGQLTGLLANFYDAGRLLNDPHRNEKLGVAGIDSAAIPVRSGYRLGDGGSRHFDAHPGASGTNVFMRTKRGVADDELIRLAGDGIYVGRVWYTYPINGQRNGDFTCTVSGDSYVIRNGKLAQPLAPNCLRINANIEQVFAHPMAVGRRLRAASVWGSPEAYFMPSLLADAITLAAIGAADSA